MDSKPGCHTVTCHSLVFSIVLEVLQCCSVSPATAVTGQMSPDLCRNWRKWDCSTDSGDVEICGDMRGECPSVLVTTRDTWHVTLFTGGDHICDTWQPPPHNVTLERAGLPPAGYWWSMVCWQKQSVFWYWADSVIVVCSRAKHDHCAELGAGKLQTPLVTWLLATLRSRVSHSSITHVSCDHLLLHFFTGHQSLPAGVFLVCDDAWTLSWRCYGFVLFDRRPFPMNVCSNAIATGCS